MFMCMTHRFSIFDGLGSLFRENIYVVCDDMFMIFSYYVIFVYYYFSPSFIVINDNFHFNFLLVIIHAHQTEQTCIDKKIHCNLQIVGFISQAIYWTKEKPV